MLRIVCVQALACRTRRTPASQCMRTTMENGDHHLAVWQAAPLCGHHLHPEYIAMPVAAITNVGGLVDLYQRVRGVCPRR